ncbi:hypothetical protein [Chryseobacterium aquaticum]|nr:hypothetical protein [Chryseobacterium aquaticum]
MRSARQTAQMRTYGLTDNVLELAYQGGVNGDEEIVLLIRAQRYKKNAELETDRQKKHDCCNVWTLAFIILLTAIMPNDK